MSPSLRGRGPVPDPVGSRRSGARGPVPDPVGSRRAGGRGPLPPARGKAGSGGRRSGGGAGVEVGRRPRRLAAGGVGLLVAVLLAVQPRLALVVLLVLAGRRVAVRLARRREAARRSGVRTEAAPAVLDLLAAALLAGLNPHLAVLRVAERAPDGLRDDLDAAVAVLRLGGTPAVALRAAAERSDLDELRAAAGALEAAERWGAPPAEALAARAEALRSRTRLRAEAEAGRAAVRLAFPLVLCFLPAFVLLTVVPTVAGSLRALTP
jgi:tight adherence protein C